ncbi:hypothetical protein [Elizabethkingia anophelis]|uniref:Uncharacterized protein n=2 Tax=Elizabethkingia TaxID=308865 RepID=A0A7Z7PYJ8_9FLAO|nr:hypothetical protein [Elizabethkingia anophelis]MDV3586877.1 hypothetical protein [Elizabethkingia anophelis]MDV3622539.1 hypothetical protein [Elizabethkingia anophelis]MDV3670434.1 hypothetical protein [Elizabethkingia anophelis]MDV3680514.1 hypothetical protein [Elizabethkingia anophelis]MDV3695140.1 hypothetical protein [Elizabethkingia anophelis]
MNATKNYIGKNTATRTAKTKATAQTVGRVRPLDAKTKRCERNTERQNESGTNSHATHAFLKCLFLPKLKDTPSKQDWKKTGKMERDFYQSLSQLAEHYEITPSPSIHLGFPYNIVFVIEDLKKQLKIKIKNWEQIRLVQDRKTYLLSEERYNTGATLYYIPIVPLYRLSKSPNYKQATQLLQSVCSYLCHIAGVPYYRQQESYLCWMYEMVSEWLIDDETEDTPEYLREIKQSEWIGDYMEQKIYNPQNLILFKERINRFENRDSFETDCLLLACDTLALYEMFPDATIYRNIQRKERNTNNDDYDEDYHERTITMEKYVSFCADDKGILFQTLFDSVNAEFQECTEIEEPSTQKRFDGTNVSNDNLDFENYIFPLIERLIDILNSI